MGLEAVTIVMEMHLRMGAQVALFCLALPRPGWKSGPRILVLFKTLVHGGNVPRLHCQDGIWIVGISVGSKVLAGHFWAKLERGETCQPA